MQKIHFFDFLQIVPDVI